MKQSSPAGEAECEHALWLRCLANAVCREQRVVPGNRGRGAVLVVPLEIVPVTRGQRSPCGVVETFPEDIAAAEAVCHRCTRVGVGF